MNYVITILVYILIGIVSSCLMLFIEAMVKTTHPSFFKAEFYIAIIFAWPLVFVLTLWEVFKNYFSRLIRKLYKKLYLYAMKRNGEM